MTAGVLTEVSGEVAVGAPGGFALVGAVVAGFVLGLVWMGLALGAVYRKVGARPVLGWIPVVRYAVLAHLTQSTVAGTVIARVLAFLGLATWAFGALLASSSAIALAGLGVAAVAGLAAWIMWIVQTHRFGLDHSLPAGLPVLAAVAPGIWAAVVGWGGMVRPVSGTVPVRAPAQGDDAPVAEPPAPASPVVASADGPAEEAPVPTPAWGFAAPAVEDMYPVEPFTGSDGYPEPAPPVEPEPEPVPTTERIAVRESPYAGLARVDADDDPRAERRSPYAELAPRDLPAAEAIEPEPVAPAASASAAPSAPSAPSEEAAWEAAVEAVPPALPEAEAAAPELESTPEPEPEPAPVAAPVYVEPTPTLPISPYMRGGAAAPPQAPTTVPTFEMPQAPAPAPEPAPDVAEDTVDEERAVPPGYHAAVIPPPPPPAPPVPAEAPAASSPAPDVDHDDRTQVSTRQREAWELLTSEGGVHRFDASAVLLGRQGGLPPVDGTRRLDLADSTRTVSKAHARLVLQAGTWWVEDLGSTNGTYLVDGDGREAQVPEGVPTPVAGRLILGDIEVEIRRRSMA
ncbi:FHA domain-containing protein [Demequina silvatica]|uniref:FHA domain-containing protein n=1 Tax=Demequina silvatica TaxID=1638988 RepID=UPI000785BF95|nr:FHA domain-containing protein [Demequina silvatica]